MLRWKLELSSFNYDITFRPGIENRSADTCSRLCAANCNENTLKVLHEKLCHAGVKRLHHFVKTKNLPYSVEDVKSVCSKCSICRQIKPTFVKTPKSHVIKATQPFERLSIDFVGPKASVTRNKYLLVVCDEYSRFVFAYPCADITSKTVIKHLTSLFSLFGNPGMIHSDRGSQFMSQEVCDFLYNNGIYQSRTTPYNPRGNGQCERVHATLWRSMQLILATNKQPIQHWEATLEEALHAQRTLLCTSTNTTPHERMFDFARRSVSGTQLPTWLLEADTVNLRRHVRNKDDPLVDEVELIRAGPNYSSVRLQNGNIDTVSTRDIAQASSSGDPRPKRTIVPPDRFVTGAQ